MRRMRVIALLLTAAGLSACTSYYGDYAYGPGYYHGDRVGWDDFVQYGDYRYDGDYYEPARWQDREAYLIGAGVEQLDPWLALTPAGRDIVTIGFDTDDDGWLAEGTAADRKSVASDKSVSERVDRGGRRIITTKNKH